MSASTALTPTADPAGSVTAPAVADAGLAESTLVGRAQDGDIDAFEALVRRYQSPIFRLCHRMLADRGDAEDIVQDTFTLVWRRLPTLADPDLFHGWIYQIATRRCLNVIRSRVRHPAQVSSGAVLDTSAARDPGPTSIDPATVAEDHARRTSLDEVLQTLPAEQRACWVLREMHDQSYPAIAAATGLPVSTVRGRLARARANLAKGMQSWR